MARADDDKDALHVHDLWYVEERTDVADWLSETCWDVTSVDAAELMSRYGRPAPTEDAIPRTVFIEGRLID